MVLTRFVEVACKTRWEELDSTIFRFASLVLSSMIEQRCKLDELTSINPQLAPMAKVWADNKAIEELLQLRTKHMGVMVQEVSDVVREVRRRIGVSCESILDKVCKHFETLQRFVDVAATSEISALDSNAHEKESWLDIWRSIAQKSTETGSAIYMPKRDSHWETLRYTKTMQLKRLRIEELRS